MELLVTMATKLAKKKLKEGLEKNWEKAVRLTAFGIDCIKWQNNPRDVYIYMTAWGEGGSTIKHPDRFSPIFSTPSLTNSAL